MEYQAMIICVVGPTASGKTKRAVEIALLRNGEVISVDSRQVYRGLDIGTEKTTREEMRGVPHHLIDIRDARDTYSAGDFVQNATSLISDITSRGRIPILCGGTHFYLDALLYGLPAETPIDTLYRKELESFSAEALFTRIQQLDPRRAKMLDATNKRRLVRALEIISIHGKVPERKRTEPCYNVEWVVCNPDSEVLRARIDARLNETWKRGLINEVKRVREEVGDDRLNELGLEYKIVGEYLKGERNEDSLIPALSNALWHLARQQKQWLKKLSL